MRCPLLSELPGPPVGKTGWPWTEESPQLPNLMPDNRPWPKISIVTPSFNQGQFIEETIRSVLLQGYPNLEYIIIDGGSSDESIDIIRRYEPWLKYWISEPDRGQTNAINKGISRASGDILAYLNSDDYYLPGALFKVGEYFKRFPHIDLLNGQCHYVNEIGEKIGEHHGDITRFDEVIDLWDVWWAKKQFVQPEIFWSRRIYESIGPFREDLYYVMDYEYWCRILKAGGKAVPIIEALSCFRFNPNQKSRQREQVAEELLGVVRPLLWDNRARISATKRIQLQGKWLYHKLLLTHISQSVRTGEGRIARYYRTLLLILQNPQILFTKQLYRRLWDIWRSKRTVN